LDADASDAIGNCHAADSSDFMRRRQLDGTTRLPWHHLSYRTISPIERKNIVAARHERVPMVACRWHA